VLNVRRSDSISVYVELMLLSVDCIQSSFFVLFD